MQKTDLIKLVQDRLDINRWVPNVEARNICVNGDNDIYDSLSALSNFKGGGVILFGTGCSDHRILSGVPNPEELKDWVLEQAGQMIPPVTVQLTETTVNGYCVVSAEISECNMWDKPCYYKNLGKRKGAFVHEREYARQMTDYEAYELEAYQNNVHEDRHLVESASIEDLSQEKLNLYLERVRQDNETLREFEAEKILRTQGLAENGIPTLAGLLLFGEYPQEFFPQLNVFCEKRGSGGNEQVYPMKNSRVKRVEGTIMQMLNKTLQFVEEYAEVGTALEEYNGSQYYREAVTELVMNALLHRDYSRYTQQTPIHLTLYEDRLEIVSPGGLYGRCTLDTLGSPMPDTRNIYLVKAAGYLMEESRRFDGIPAVISMCRRENKQPAFTEGNGTFKVVINKNYNLDNPRQKMEEKIMDYCTTPRTREELARYFGIETTSYIVKKYMNPLVQQGKIQMTIPEKPKSKFQKYFRNTME